MKNLVKVTSSLLFTFRTIESKPFKVTTRSLVQLSPVHLQVQETCRAFADKELKPHAAKFDKEATFPEDQFKKLFLMGMMGVCVPEKYGGSGMDTLALAIAIEEISRGCASTGLVLSIHNALCVNLLSRFEETESLCQYCRDGKLLFFALSEADAGSDVASLSTVATQEQSNWVLTGTKAWVTTGREANAGIVFAKTDASKKHKGISAFLVETSDPGLTVSPSEDKLGVRATSTCSVYLDRAKGHLIGKPGEGFKIAMTQLDQGRIGIASQALGIAQAAMDLAVNYASQRQAFGRPLLKMSSVKNRIAEVALSIEAARGLTRSAAMRYDLYGSATKYSSMAKLASSAAATFAAHNCTAIMGGMGVVASSDAGRHYRDARMTEIYGGITDIQKITVAEQVIRDYSL